jgi:hypothetical protein
MGKRVGAANTGASKKAKVVNPVFAEIQDALKKAEDLPENCRAMLAAMVPASFATSREARSEQQATIIQWVEDALQNQEAKFLGDVNGVAAKLVDLEAVKASCVADAQKVEATIAEKKETLNLKKHALAEATIAMTATKKSLAEAQDEQRLHDSDFIAMKKEQEGLAAAFVEHFKAPLDAGEALHYGELQPFLSKLDLEESFMVSAPSSCCKTKEQRGSFDNVVIEALQEALLERATQIKDTVSNRSPESEAREVAVQKAEAQLVVDRAAQEKAAAELAAAQKDVEIESTILKEKEQAVARCDTEIKAVSEQHEKLRLTHDGFEQGPLTSFRNSRDWTATADVCATAGA